MPDITDSWDRRLNAAYVNQFLREEIIRNPGDVSSFCIFMLFLNSK